jgi:hypothetical protein
MKTLEKVKELVHCLKMYSRKVIKELSNLYDVFCILVCMIFIFVVGIVLAVVLGWNFGKVIGLILKTIINI